ncbi:MAG: hypothetical protein MMC33_009748 [Icmadophila ericetorum]|nr:hypothetical protein [Icmadophila ericetorum]
MDSKNRLVPKNTGSHLENEDVIYILHTSGINLSIGYHTKTDFLRSLVDLGTICHAVAELDLGNSTRSPPYVIWIIPLEDAVSAHSLAEAGELLFNRVRSGITATSVLFKPREFDSSTCLVVAQGSEDLPYPMSPTLSRGTCTVSTSATKSSQSYSQTYGLSSMRSHTVLVACTIFMSLLAILVVLSYLQRLASSYRTPPLAFKPFKIDRLEAKNVTTWLTHHQSGSNFTLRLDDQLLMPTSLLSAEDLRLNAWFEEAYPALRSFSKLHPYLKPDYLANDSNIVLVDGRFHAAHCLLEFRRLWQNGEGNLNPCDKDMNHDHMQHCFTKLRELVMGPLDKQSGTKVSHLNFTLDACYESD